MFEVLIGFRASKLWFSGSDFVTEVRFGKRYQTSNCFTSRDSHCGSP